MQSLFVFNSKDSARSAKLQRRIWVSEAWLFLDPSETATHTGAHTVTKLDVFLNTKFKSNWPKVHFVTILNHCSCCSRNSGEACGWTRVLSSLFGRPSVHPLPLARALPVSRSPTDGSYVHNPSDSLESAGCATAVRRLGPTVCRSLLDIPDAF